MKLERLAGMTAEEREESGARGAKLASYLPDGRRVVIELGGIAQAS